MFSQAFILGLSIVTNVQISYSLTKKKLNKNWGTVTQVLIQSVPIMLLQLNQSVEPSLILVENC
jgi:hypothetical protein